MEGRSLSVPLGSLRSSCLFPNCSMSCQPCEECHLSLSYPNHSTVATLRMVSQPVIPLDGQTPGTSSGVELAHSATLRKFHLTLDILKPYAFMLYSYSLGRESFLTKVQKRSICFRKSFSQVYQGKWSVFYEWYHGRDISPVLQIFSN